MKKIRKLAIMLAAVTALVLLPASNAFPSKAAEPVTYAVKYVSDELGWRFQANTSVFDSSNNGREMYYLLQDIKEGDLVVIYNDSDNAGDLNLGNVRLSNVTYTQGCHFTIVFAGSVDDCYVLGGSTGTINCDVKNAYVYDTVTFNFNNNVDNLYLYAADKINSTLGVSGTVGHLTASTPPGQEPYRVAFDYYDFPAGTLRFNNGAFQPSALGFKTPEEHAQQSPQPLPETSQPEVSQPETSQTASPDPSDEYDDVPKTGQSNLYLWLLLGAGICFTGSFLLNRSER